MFQGHQREASKDRTIEFNKCPIRGNNSNGKVERKIPQIEELLEKSVINQTLFVLQWETVAAEINDGINAMQ